MTGARGGLSYNGFGQRFYYDENVAAMEETSGRIAGGRKSVGRTALHGLHYYMRDELGSPLRVSRFGAEVNSSMSRNRYLTYGYDEFGNDLGNDLGRELKEAGIPNVYDRPEAEQPFGYTGDTEHILSDGVIGAISGAVAGRVGGAGAS